MGIHHLEIEIGLHPARNRPLMYWMANRKLLSVNRVQVKMRAPRQHAGLRNAASAFEIDQPKLAATNKNVLGLAVAPDVSALVNRIKQGLELP